MKKIDIGVVAAMYIICGAAFVATTKLDADSQIYPHFCTGLLFALTTLYLIQMAVAAKKYGVESGVKEVFEGFIPKQFFTCVLACIAYMVVMYFVGFYISTVIFLLCLLLYLKTPPLHTAIVVAVLVLLVYFAFSKFLGVRLPAGLLFK